jgi:hypothetical protein
MTVYRGVSRERGSRVRAREGTLDVNMAALDAPRRNKMRKSNMEVLGLPRIGGVLVRNTRTGDVVLLDPRPVEQREPQCADRTRHRPIWVTRAGWTRCPICPVGSTPLGTFQTGG